ncbi:MICAL-like protein 2 isoform X2 [Saccostrea echinata]|uniref:MICAL-like protein 2 isoform X2 n=1 Tax=Saccostrea echinata TaxID=191078 RepID=UPI002A80DE90|nr:MICAL-like protein 2 isoform X2 [Saccostrea echinata]
MGTKVQALQLWCKKQTDGYRDVEVINMTSSWKSGLAFCAIIHRYRPDLIDYDALAKENVLENNSLAFDVADRELGIPALLDAPDMVAIKVPDKLSVVTYVSQYYNYFHNKPQLGGPGVKKSVKRHQEIDKSGPEAKRQTLVSVNDSPAKEKQVSMGDKCGICKNKVFLLERHIENGKLYHRSCFRKSELSPTAKILKKPDSEKSDQSRSHDSEKPDFWRRRADAKKNEQIKKEEPKKELKEKHDTRTNKAKSLNFSLHNSDEHKSSPSGVTHRQEEKMDTSDLSGDHEVKSRVEANSNRPVPKARNVISSTGKIDSSDKNQNEVEKRTSVPKFEFRSKIVSAAPKACVVSKIDTDNSKPEPSTRHSAPSKPSSLSESPRSSKSHQDGSPPPLPKNHPPHLPVTSKKESPVSEKKSLSPPSVKSPLSSAEVSPKQDRLSELLAKDNQSSQGKWEGLSSTNQESTPFSSSNTKQESHAVRKPKDINISDVRTGSSSEPVAVLMSPVSPEPHDPQVLGGLLKNLANVRRRKDSSEDVTSPKAKDEQSKNIDWRSNKASSDTRKEVKSHVSREVNGKTETRADKAKSVDILSEKKSFFSNKKESDKPVKKDLTVSDEEPAWKKALEERKKKKQRPKSADLLSNKKEEKSSRSVVSMDVTQVKDERPAWQIEAEKRKAARQGGYVDPEKAKDSTTETSVKTEVSEVTKRLITPGLIPKDEPKVSEPEKKIISVGKKFEFKLHDHEKEKKVTEKPPRPPPMSPTSLHKSHHGLSPAVSHKLASTKKTPAPLRPTMPRTEIKTFGDMKRLSPKEIQHQLAEIDSRLTDLEIRGRSLEESIRKDHSEEEDEGLMIEWFNLVNDKNELVRTEADLIYVSRAQELEDQQHRIDRELRELLTKEEDRKTEEDKEQEELLLQQLVDVVNQRSLIVDCQDEDRIRYEEEDRDIAEILAKKGFLKAKN